MEELDNILVDGGQRIGYARVSTKGQARLGYSLEAQIEMLEKHGCVKIFEDAYTGKTMHRPGFDKALSYLREGDVLVVTKLDRLGRSTAGVMALYEELKERNVFIEVLDMPGMTSGKFAPVFLAMLSAVAEIERETILERTQAGREAARVKREELGIKPRARKPVYSVKTYRKAKSLVDAGATVVEACRAVGISRATYYVLQERHEKA